MILTDVVFATVHHIETGLNPMPYEKSALMAWKRGGRFRSTDRFLKDDTGAHFADGSASSLREPAVVALESPDTTNPYVLKARHPVQP